MIDKLKQLLTYEDKPTQFAYENVLIVLSTIGVLLGIIPDGQFAVNEEGAIYIYWKNKERYLQYTFPENNNKLPYLYLKEPGGSSIIPNCSVHTIIVKLKDLYAII